MNTVDDLKELLYILRCGNTFGIFKNCFYLTEILTNMFVKFIDVHR